MIFISYMDPQSMVCAQGSCGCLLGPRRILIVPAFLDNFLRAYRNLSSPIMIQPSWKISDFLGNGAAPALAATGEKSTSKEKKNQ